MDMNMGILRGAIGGGASGRTFEPQRTNNAVFEVDLSGVPGAESEALSFGLANAPIPKSANGIVVVGFLNYDAKFAGRATFEDLTFTFYDLIDVPVARTLLAWRYLVNNPHTGQNGLKANYAKNGRLKLYAPDGSEDTVRIWKILGMWPTNFDGGEADMSGEEPVRINCTFAVERCIPDQGLNPLGLPGELSAG